MMKSILSILLVCVFGILTIGQVSAQNKEMKAGDEMTWDEAKEEFHMVMAATFHPAEEGDLQPLKDQYKDLAKQAKMWSMLAVPKELAGKGLKEKIDQLHTDSKALEKLVMDKASDDDLKKAIYGLHDIFHEIVGLCDH